MYVTILVNNLKLESGGGRKVDLNIIVLKSLADRGLVKEVKREGVSYNYLSTILLLVLRPNLIVVDKVRYVPLTFVLIRS